MSVTVDCKGEKISLSRGSTMCNDTRLVTNTSCDRDVTRFQSNLVFEFLTHLDKYLGLLLRECYVRSMS